MLVSLVWVGLGALVGWMVALVIEGTSSRQMVFDVVFGAVGGLLGGFAAQHYASGQAGGLNLNALFLAALVAIVVVAVEKFIRQT